MSIQKGSIIVHDGTRVIAVAPGTDGDSLEFDSTTASGLKTKKNQKIAKLPVTKNSSTSNTTYTTIYKFQFPGTNDSTITSIKFISYMDNTVTSYDIRLYDFTNDTVLGSGNYTNEVSAINTISSISNLPTSEAVFEIQFKRNGGSGNKNVFVDDVTIFYN